MPRTVILPANWTPPGEEEEAPRKYRNRPVEVDGQHFDSQAEARRYQDLRLLAEAGEIRGLVCQPRYPMIVNGQRVGTYIADFAYYDSQTHQVVVEDVKGVRTAVYRLKKRLMLACCGIEVREVRA